MIGPYLYFNASKGSIRINVFTKLKTNIRCCWLMVKYSSDRPAIGPKYLYKTGKNRNQRQAVKYTRQTIFTMRNRLKITLLQLKHLEKTELFTTRHQFRPNFRP